MIKVVYFVSVAICVVFTVIGAIFKLLHLPGSMPVLSFGLLIGFVIGIVIFVGNYKGNSLLLTNTTIALRNVSNVIMVISGLLILVGILFKLLHLPGAMPTIYCGLIGIFVNAVLILITNINAKRHQ